MGRSKTRYFERRRRQRLRTMNDNYKEKLNEERYQRSNEYQKAEEMKIMYKVTTPKKIYDLY